MSIRLREATRDDVAAIGVFQTAAWADAYTGMVRQAYLDGVSAEERASRWLARFGERRILLAIDPADRIVGVASTRPDAEPLELSTLYVASVHQGAGAGSRLLTAVLGDSPAQLWVFEANARAIRFYERHAFALTGERTFDDPVGLHELRMLRGGPPTRRSET